MPDDSAFILEPVPHDEAAKWISDKPIVSREVFDSLLPELKARAFLITGIEDANTVQEIRDLIAEVPKGAEWETQKKAIIEKLGPWMKPEGAAARAEILLRTHGFQAYQLAQHKVMESQADVFPFWQYISLGDEKVRPAHAALNERIVPANDPFWHDHSPPWQWGCRCRKVSLLPDEVDEIQAEDAKKAPESKRLLEGTALDKARNGQLDAGPAKQVDIRSDRMRGKADGYHFDPSGLTIPVKQLKERYDDATWSEFEAAAQANKLPDGRTVWDWLNGSKSKARKAKGQAPATPPAPAPTPAPSPVQAPATTPAGTPLKGKLKPVAKMSKTERARVDKVLKIIDSVHGDGPLTDIPVGNNPGNSLGYFWGASGIKAKEIQYRKPKKGQSYIHPELTLAHEIGHWLDHSGKGKDTFATDNLTTELAGWWKAIQDSQAYQAFDSNPRLTPGQLIYYKSPIEAWARSYAQFIAEESGDATLIGHVATIRTEPVPNRQWETDDFAPIRDEIRKVFEGRSWMKSAQKTP
ncbi:phage minor head protein [Prosthecobacter dejongeii]|uniref:SPP1 gp7 family putative phage head morphogenesis protein n=1 Tax=Prosthecobacter dejongeii TaxID=48465 RepID=A0A7W8DP72_9BACT|nr:phage minor head protein [Prosthecobacter dejongeii]MBB5037143.1 SPP1 gp7 family putative phage head morphogenesis protein [Prosthecobacter dejongeii]